MGDPLQVPEQFEIRVDSPNTSRKAILGAVPVGWGSRHWEFTGLTAQQFNLKPRSENGMRWILEVLFTLPTREKLLDDETGIPKDYWEAIGGTTTQPAFADDEGTLIVNSAGDPMEGLEREREEAAWSLTKFYGDIAENWAIDRASFAGHCNQFEWAGGAPMTWKCYFKGATPKVIQYVNRGKASSGEPTGGPGADATIETLTIVETKWEFRYEPLTWKCMPWDVGFQEIVGSGGERKVILCDDQKPVRQPVALNADGTRKTPGAPPAVIRGGNGAKLYGVAHFGATFGTPRIIPEEGGS